MLRGPRNRTQTEFYEPVSDKALQFIREVNAHHKAAKKKVTPEAIAENEENEENEDEDADNGDQGKYSDDAEDDAYIEQDEALSSESGESVGALIKQDMTKKQKKKIDNKAKGGKKRPNNGNQPVKTKARKKGGGGGRGGALVPKITKPKPSFPTSLPSSYANEKGFEDLKEAMDDEMDVNELQTSPPNNDLFDEGYEPHRQEIALPSKYHLIFNV